MKIENLRDLFVSELCYAYDCEQKLVKKGLPAMLKSASSPELKQAFEQHLEETRTHVSRLEKVFNACGFEIKKKDNDILDEMTDAAEDTVSHIDESALRDAALIVNGNGVEHYEMAIYGSLVAFADQLGLAEVSMILQQTLEEEKEADAKLTKIGESVVNPLAAGERRAA